MKGKLILPREIIFNPELFKNLPAFRLYMLLIGRAAFKNIEIEGVSIERGQYLRSMRNLQKDLTTIDNNQLIEPDLCSIRRSIQFLVKKQLVTIENKGQKGTLFTVLNYHEMQQFEAGSMTHPVDTLATGGHDTLATGEKAAPQQHFEHFETEARHTQEQGARHTGMTQKELMNLKELNKHLKEEEEEEGQEEPLNLYVLVEKYRHIINRPLTRTQIEFIGAAIDDGIEIKAIDFLMTQAALKDYPMSYINTCLQDWFKHNIRTVEQAKQRVESYNNKNKKKKGGGGIGNSPQIFDRSKNYGF